MQDEKVSARLQKEAFRVWKWNIDEALRRGAVFIPSDSTIDDLIEYGAREDWYMVGQHLSRQTDPAWTFASLFALGLYLGQQIAQSQEMEAKP